jgi:hypothetical protein
MTAPIAISATMNPAKLTRSAMAPMMMYPAVSMNTTWNKKNASTPTS